MGWNEAGDRVAIHTDKALFLLRFHPELLKQGSQEGNSLNSQEGGSLNSQEGNSLNSQEGSSQEGEENAGLFEVEQEVSVASRDGFWYKEAYFYVAGSKLHRLLGEDDAALAFVPPHRAIVRYLPAQDCLYCVDAKVGVMGWCEA